MQTRSTGRVAAPSATEPLAMKTSVPSPSSRYSKDCTTPSPPVAAPVSTICTLRISVLPLAAAYSAMLSSPEMPRSETGSVSRQSGPMSSTSSLAGRASTTMCTAPPS